MKQQSWEGARHCNEVKSQFASGGLVSEAQWSTSKQNWYIYKQHRRLIRVAISTPMGPSNISYNHRGYNPVISWTPWTHHGITDAGIQVIEIRRKPGKTMNSWDANSPVRRTVVHGKIHDPSSPFRWVKFRLGSANPSTIGVATWGVESTHIDSHLLQVPWNCCRERVSALWLKMPSFVPGIEPFPRPRVQGCEAESVDFADAFWIQEHCRFHWVSRVLLPFEFSFTINIFADPKETRS